MRITSTKLAQSAPRALSQSLPPATTQSQPIAGVILATAERQFGVQPETGHPVARLPAGVYVFPSQKNLSFPGTKRPSDPLGSEITAIAKQISIHLGAHLHPHLGTGIRAGWIVVGALSLLNRAQSEQLPWHEVALQSGGLALDAFTTANATLPQNLQIGADWSEGVSLLLDATSHAVGGGDANQFVMNKVLDQSPPIACARKLIALAIDAQNPSPTYNYLALRPVDAVLHPPSTVHESRGHSKSA